MIEDGTLELFVGGLVLDPSTKAPIILLKDAEEEFCLPIWIGIAEATSIASAMKQIEIPRPLTHDLMVAMMNLLQVRLQKVLITEIRDATYIAELILASNAATYTLDCRPSDAIALAVRFDLPILVTESVMEQGKVAIEKEGQPANSEGEDKKGVTNWQTLNKEELSELLEDLDPDDFDCEM